MNNFHFCLARYLRDEGYDVTLFLLNEFPHFLPVCDTYNVEDLVFVKSLDWYKKGHWKTSKEEILQVTQEFDFIIGTDIVPAFFYKAGIALDLMFPLGGDIFFKPYFKYRKHIPFRAQIGEFYFRYCQRRGLREAKAVSLPIYGNEFENHFRKLKINENRQYVACPSIYLPQYKGFFFEQYRKDSEYCKKVESIKTHTDFLIIQHSRQEISDPNSLHYKGNEKLFYAAKQLMMLGLNFHIVLFEYGSDIEASKRIIKELGIFKYVTWLPMMFRKDIMPLLGYADVSVCTLHKEQFVTYGAVLESLVMKVPVIHHYDSEMVRRSNYQTIYPYYNAYTVEELKHALLMAYNDRLYNEKKKEEGYRWVLQNVINQSVQQTIKLIKNKLENG